MNEYQTEQLERIREIIKNEIDRELGAAMRNGDDNEPSWLQGELEFISGLVFDLDRELESLLRRSRK